MEGASAPGQSHGECPALRTGRGKGSDKETEEKRKPGRKRGQSGNPGTRNRVQEGTVGGQWGQHQWQELTWWSSG